mmetsp:Transcript_39975/g.159054  ORF Transcript_39975/g.159054 Transcript_39975/m.159054 type:complete len:86 (-) Transcript_39975:383-640(-)
MTCNLEPVRDERSNLPTTSPVRTIKGGSESMDFIFVSMDSSKDSGGSHPIRPNGKAPPLAEKDADGHPFARDTLCRHTPSAFGGD